MFEVRNPNERNPFRGRLRAPEASAKEAGTATSAATAIPAPELGEIAIRVRVVKVDFGSQTVLDHPDLDVRRGKALGLSEPAAPASRA